MFEEKIEEPICSQLASRPGQEVILAGLVLLAHGIPHDRNHAEDEGDDDGHVQAVEHRAAQAIGCGSCGQALVATSMLLVAISFIGFLLSELVIRR